MAARLIHLFNKICAVLHCSWNDLDLYLYAKIKSQISEGIGEIIGLIS